MIVKEDELPANTPLVDKLRRIHPEAWADITEPGGWSYSANYVGRITHEAADVIDAALERAAAAERERDAALKLVNELRIELLKLKQDMARKLLGGLAMVWTPEQIVKWAEERK